MREDDDESNFIYKNNVKEVLTKLEAEAHYMYALLYKFPKLHFCINRFYDIANNVDVYFEDVNGENSKFTIQEFYDRYDTFHPDDDFGIHFSAHGHHRNADEIEEQCDCIDYHDRNDLTVESLTKSFFDFLEPYCENCLRNNQPLELTPETIKFYGLTPEDVEQLRKPLARFDRKAKKVIMAEYKALSELDFIRKKQK